MAIPLLNGGQETLKVPAGVQSGEVFKLRGVGLKELGGHRSGDLYVQVMVKTPDRLDREQKPCSPVWPSLRGERLDEVDRSVLEKYQKLVGSEDRDQ